MECSEQRWALRLRLAGLAIGILFVVVPKASQAQGESDFRRLRGFELQGVKFTDLVVTSAAVDSWESTTAGTKSFVRLIFSGTLALNHGSPGASVLAGPFAGTLNGYFLAERGNALAIKAVTIAKGALHLRVKPSVSPSLPIAHLRTFPSTSLLVENSTEVVLSVDAVRGQLDIQTVAPVSLKGASVLGPGSVSDMVSQAPLRGIIDLENAQVVWQPMIFNLSKGRSALSAASEYMNLSTSNATFQKGLLKADNVESVVTLESLEFDKPDVSSKGGEKVEATTSATAARASASFGRDIDAPPIFKAQGVLVLPDKDRLVELLNDNTKAGDRLVPTGLAKAPFAKTYALRNLQIALRDALLTPELHTNIIGEIDETGTLSEVSAEQDSSPTAHYVCFGITWLGKLALDRAEIAVMGQTFIDLGFAAGLTVGALTSPAWTPFVMGGVVAAGAVGSWAATEYATGLVEDTTGAIGFPKFTRSAIAKSLAEKGFTKVCELAVDYFTGTEKTLPRLSRIANLPARQPGEQDADLITRREKSLLQSKSLWPPATPARRESYSVAACCDRAPFQRALQADAKILSAYTAAKTESLRTEIAQTEAARNAAWTTQQQSNARDSRSTSAEIDAMRAAAAQQMESLIGGTSTVIGQDGSWTFGASSGQAGGSGSETPGGDCTSCCTLNCLSLSVPPPHF